MADPDRFIDDPGFAGCDDELVIEWDVNSEIVQWYLLERDDFETFAIGSDDAKNLLIQAGISM